MEAKKPKLKLKIEKNFQKLKFGMPVINSPTIGIHKELEVRKSYFGGRVD